MPSVLVVSTLEDRDELVQPLRNAAIADVYSGGGDDDSLALCERVQPAVVVVSARLERGDVAEFIDAVEARCQAAIVLVSDAPTELARARDIAAAQVLLRPLPASALVDAVEIALDAAELALVGDDPGLGAAVRLSNDELADAPVDDEPEFEFPAGAATPAWREPTMILGDGGDAAAGVGVMSEPEPATPIEWSDSGPTPLPAPLPFLDNGEEFEEFQLQFEDDLGEELKADLDDTAGGAAASPAGAGSDGTFGNALRRKMSALEERLFPGRSGTAGTASAPATATAAVAAPSVQATRGAIMRGRSDAAMLVQRMYRERLTGRLCFRRQEIDKSVVFVHGRPVFATSNQAEDRLAAGLARAGKITPAQAEASYERARSSGKRMGEVLVEMGFLKRRELLPAVRHHLEELVYSLFAWDQGEFEIELGDFAAGERIRLDRHPAAIVLEGVRRKYHGAALAAIVAPPDSVIDIIDDAQRATIMSVAELSPAERAVMLAFDGRRDLASIVDDSGLGRLGVYQLAYGLVALDAARVRSPGERLPVAAGEDEVAAAGGDSGEGATTDAASELAIDRQRILARYALLDDADYFTLLGVRRDATGFEIRRAYQAARRDYAPEHIATPLRAELEHELTDIGEVLDEAYRVLADDELRHAYLTHLQA
ncbi:DUF4388 domain-containing protein [Haliangium sp.]|uniref:DUF4388 domain-containing protein n=1 Tax=Haliangium sp. TaxID=2663208 RepID=UPI003D0AD49E